MVEETAQLPQETVKPQQENRAGSDVLLAQARASLAIRWWPRGLRAAGSDGDRPARALGGLEAVGSSAQPPCARPSSAGRAFLVAWAGQAPAT